VDIKRLSFKRPDYQLLQVRKIRGFMDSHHMTLLVGKETSPNMHSEVLQRITSNKST